MNTPSPPPPSACPRRLQQHTGGPGTADRRCDSGQCHSDRVRGALGLAASDATVARARVDSDSLHVRVLRHDGPRVPPASEGGDRLTIEKGRTNNITAIYCG